MTFKRVDVTGFYPSIHPSIQFIHSFIHVSNSSKQSNSILYFVCVNVRLSFQVSFFYQGTHWHISTLTHSLTDVTLRMSHHRDATHLSLRLENDREKCMKFFYMPTRNAAKNSLSSHKNYPCHHNDKRGGHEPKSENGQVKDWIAKG